MKKEIYYKYSIDGVECPMEFYDYDSAIEAAHSEFAQCEDLKSAEIFKIERERVAITYNKKNQK